VSGWDKFVVTLLVSDGKYVVELWTLLDIKNRYIKEIAKEEEVI